jgi:hypothetical protein
MVACPSIPLYHQYYSVNLPSRATFYQQCSSSFLWKAMRLWIPVPVAVSLWFQDRGVCILQVARLSQTCSLAFLPVRDKRSICMTFRIPPALASGAAADRYSFHEVSSTVFFNYSPRWPGFWQSTFYLSVTLHPFNHSNSRLFRH